MFKKTSKIPVDKWQNQQAFQNKKYFQTGAFAFRL